MSSLAGFRLVPSPRSGVDLEEFIASLVFGFERVPRTDLECNVSTIVADVIRVGMFGDVTTAE